MTIILYCSPPPPNDANLTVWHTPTPLGRHMIFEQLLHDFLLGHCV